MVVERVREVGWPVARAVAGQVDQQRAVPAQRRFVGDRT
jgi:hypothetical protein